MGSSLVSPIKKIKTSPCPMCSLPPEVMVEILARLPVESLLRFKCVCKSWKAMFEGPKFVATHLLLHRDRDRAAAADENKICFVVGRQRFSNCAGEKENFLCLLSGEDQVTDLDFPFSCCRYALDLVISGHCNGVICLHHHEHVVLCNPATKEFKLLPPSCIPQPEIPETRNGIRAVADTRGVGFGYDQNSGDYKVVRVIGFHSDRDPLSDVLPPRVEVYNLTTDSWREIENVKLAAKILYHSCSESYLNGVYYWWAMESEKRLVLTFDMAHEVFDKIPLPELNYDDYVNLATLNECLALIVQPKSGIENSLDIWVRDELGRSWTKRASIGPVPVKFEIPITFRRNDELLLQDADGQMVCYNLNTGAAVRLPLRGSLFSFFAAVCVKSLVSIN